MRRKPNVVTTIKVIRHEWAARPVRIYERTAKKVFLGKPARIRKAGRPRLRWLDCTDNVRNRWMSRNGRRKQKNSYAWAII
jgi:hypothetical protein